jgi:anti-sigma regulatory factor (Ser/Thr protein kinase)
VVADRRAIKQIIVNLLSNAVKFTPAGGHIFVKASQVDDRIRIEVADTGIGIDPSFLPHVFDRFRQADSGTTRSYGGLGLGLAIVHDLVRLHGGDVDVHSDGVGRGATFVVTLRATPAVSRPLERWRRPRKATSLAGHAVMLVEDHEDSRELFAEALKNAGATVAAFGGAAEAFAALDEIRPSVIVSDIGLPGEDGYSFIRRVRAHAVADIQSVPAIARHGVRHGAGSRGSAGCGFSATSGEADRSRSPRGSDPRHLPSAGSTLTAASRRPSSVALQRSLIRNHLSGRDVGVERHRPVPRCADLDVMPSRNETERL